MFEKVNALESYLCRIEIQFSDEVSWQKVELESYLCRIEISSLYGSTLTWIVRIVLM